MIESTISRFAGELVALRRDLHMHPELMFEEVRTSSIVAEELRRLGFEVTTGIAGTGVVGTLRNGTSNRAIGIRADMDALPILETTNLAYASRTPGKMHACGHDGHTTMLLGLARYLAETWNFNGTVNLIFQPAEEDQGGARRMLQEGLLRRFPCDAVFALHNIPGEAPGQILVRPGAITAAVDIVDVVVRGVAGHAALPHLAIDPIVAASSIVMALQTIVSRNLDPHDPAVVTVGAINGGVMATAIPESVRLQIGVRTVSKQVGALMARRLPEIIQAQAQSYGCVADVNYMTGEDYPPGYNTPELAGLVRDVALAMGQDPERVDMRGPFMFSEDFACIQEVVPSCYLGIGNGASRGLHDPGYDFNDELLVKGPAFWARLVERFLPA
jgi:hippurate hydrolase